MTRFIQLSTAFAAFLFTFFIAQSVHAGSGGPAKSLLLSDFLLWCKKIGLAARHYAYKHSNYRGSRWKPFCGSKGKHWHNKISSFKVPYNYVVKAEDWTASTIPRGQKQKTRYYAGHVTYVGGYMNDRASKMQLMYWPDVYKKCVRAHRDHRYTGEQYLLCQDNIISSSYVSNWNDRISSFIVPHGKKIRFCQNKNMTGKCVDYKTSQYKLYSPYNDTFSSFQILDVVPDPVRSLRVKKVSTGIQIYWQAPGYIGAAISYYDMPYSYQIFRVDTSTGQETWLRTLNQYHRTYLDIGTSPGKTYSYKIRGCNKYGSCSSFAFTPDVTAFSIPAVPSGLRLTNLQANSASLVWNPVNGAARYRLEWKWSHQPERIFSQIYYGSRNYVHLVNKLRLDKSYDFRVRACTTSSTTYCSNYSSWVTRHALEKIETIPNLTLATNNAANQLSFSWDAIDKAVEYRLEQKLRSAPTVSFVESYKGSNPAASLSNLTPFQTYDFRVRACPTNTTNYCSPYSSLVVATPVSNAPEIASLAAGSGEENSIEISWNNIAHASEYRLEAKSADANNYEEVYKGINFSTNLSKLANQDLVNFASYNFRVRACAANTDAICSAYSAVATTEFHTSMKLVANNPLYDYQWHLKNTGAAENFFSGEAGEAGVDINVEDVHSQLGLGGKDISVVIVDDGLDSTHPDLRVGTEHSYNFVDGSTDPYTGDEYAHGTAVGGIVAMLNDSTGGVGIAPRVNLYGRNYIGYDDSGAADFDCRANSHTCVIYSLGILNEVDTQALIYENEVEDEIDVYNNSWGSKPVSHHTFYEYTLLNVYGRYPRYGRNYKGLVYIKSSGNNFVNNANADCSDAQDRGVSCANSSYQSLHSIAEFVVVGAHGADGTTSSETSSGAQVWISAPAGEYGYEADRGLLDFTQDASGNISPHTYYRYFSHRYEPTILTADNSSCSAGYSNDGDETSKNNFDYVWQGKHSLSDEVYTSLFDRIYEEFTLNFLSSRNGGLESNNKIGPHPLNPDCDYTSTFSGTSAAAPMVTGVVALMLDANPDLTWRDIKHILAHTAVNDQDDNRLALTPVELSFPATDVVINPGWTENAAGYRHSSRFGFGRVDAKAAVDLARNTTANTRGNYTIAWATNSATDTLTSASSVVNTITSSITLSQQTIEDPEYLDVNRPELGTKGIPQFIEHTRINLTFEHAKLEDTIVTLISPSGTRSILHWPIGGNNNINSFDNASLATAAFYGEDATGEWTLEISDLGADVAEDGSLISWNLDIRGR